MVPDVLVHAQDLNALEPGWIVRGPGQDGLDLRPERVPGGAELAGKALDRRSLAAELADRPPDRTGAEKGGVEGDIGWFRRNHLVPIPEVDSIEELNAMVDAWDRSADDRRISSRAHTIGEHFAAEQPLLAFLPVEEFETGRWFTPRVDRFAQVSVRMNKYSVPARYVGRQVRVLLHASELVVYDGQTVVARHERLMTKSGVQLDLDHYLEVLFRKPRALPGATALEQARKAGRFTPIHDEWWAAACKTHGDADGTRALIEVLLLHRHLAHEHVVAGLAAALRAGGHTADVVALEARKAEDSTHDNGGAFDTADSTRSDTTGIASLTERRLRKPLPVDTRPLPTVDQYDQLLHRPSRVQE